MSAVVLLVEDEAMLRDAFRVLLEDAGLHVLEAGTGAEALDAARRTHPDVVFMDLGLPDGSGLELIGEIRGVNGLDETPIVALTGRHGSEERQACMDAGFDDYLEKPVRPSALLAYVRRLQGGSGAPE